MSTDLDSDAILARLRDLSSDRIAVDPMALRPGAKLADIGIDSFALIELVFVAEEAFGIKIPMEGLHPVTLGDVIEVIKKHAAADRSSD